jgi:hypothetical protein
MIKLTGFPKNKEKFNRLIEFFKKVLSICTELDISPIVDGSLAVFAYTKNPNITINDIDLSLPESEYPKIMKALENGNIECKMMEWHVLRVLKDDLKIEFGDIEYWFSGIPIEHQILQIDKYKIKILSLKTLTAFYKRGMEDRLKKVPLEKEKYGALKYKYDLLRSIS